MSVLCSFVSALQRSVLEAPVTWFDESLSEGTLVCPVPDRLRGERHWRKVFCFYLDALSLAQVLSLPQEGSWFQQEGSLLWPTGTLAWHTGFVASQGVGAYLPDQGFSPSSPASEGGFSASGQSGESWRPNVLLHTAQLNINRFSFGQESFPVFVVDNSLIITRLVIFEPNYAK